MIHIHEPGPDGVDAAAPSAINPVLCPLCGRDNSCLPASQKAQPASSCWCMSTEVPAALLARLPAEAQDKACICQACINAYNAQE